MVYLNHKRDKKGNEKMNFENVLIIAIIFAIPAAFILTVISAMFTPANAESLRGERRKVIFEGEEFEFRFWEDQTFGLKCGVYAPRPPKKVLWKYVNNDLCIAETFGESDPIKWCFSHLKGFYADRCLLRQGEKKLKELPLVEQVEIKRNIFGELSIEIAEKEILFYYK